MKTKQLKEIAKENGYYVQNASSDSTRLVFYMNGILTVSVPTKRMKDFKIYEPERINTALFVALTNYALTFPEDREDKKYYRLRLDAPDAGSMPLYYSKKPGIGGTNLNTCKPLNNYLIFSEEELEKINEQGFTREPVFQN